MGDCWLPLRSLEETVNGGHRQPAPLPVSSSCLREGGASESYRMSGEAATITSISLGEILLSGKPHTRGGLLWAYKPNKTTSLLMEEDHHLVTAPPTLSSFDASAGLLVDEDPDATGNLGTNLPWAWMRNLILAFPHGDLKAPQTKRQTAGQWTGQVRVLQACLSPTHGFSSKDSRAIQLWCLLLSEELSSLITG